MPFQSIMVIENGRLRQLLAEAIGENLRASDITFTSQRTKSAGRTRTEVGVTFQKTHSDGVGPVHLDEPAMLQALVTKALAKHLPHVQVSAVGIFSNPARLPGVISHEAEFQCGGGQGQEVFAIVYDTMLLARIMLTSKGAASDDSSTLAGYRLFRQAADPVDAELDVYETPPSNESFMAVVGFSLVEAGDAVS